MSRDWAAHIDSTRVNDGVLPDFAALGTTIAGTPKVSRRGIFGAGAACDGCKTRGDPQSPLLGTCKRLRNLSQSRRDMCHKIDRTVIGLASTALTSHRNGTTRLSPLTR